VYRHYSRGLNQRAPDTQLDQEDFDGHFLKQVIRDAEAVFG
jgi:hypothetical protein